MALSKMMEHYLSVKEKYSDAIVFYRLGDFYEMFFEDAIEASKVLDLTLTGRDCGLEQRAPMCGIPFHAAESYIAKLVEEGYKVAICEQLSEPSPGKMVDRDVIRIVTPGTLVDESMLDNSKNNYIMSIYLDAKKTFAGIAYCDISTGEFVLEEVLGDEKKLALELNDIITRVVPTEIITNINSKSFLTDLVSVKNNQINTIGECIKEDFKYADAVNVLKEQFGDNFAEDFNINRFKTAVVSGGSLIEYIKETQKRGLSHINKITVKNELDIMRIDNTTRRNLELTETLRDRKKRGSLLNVIDNTSTSMGERLLRTWLLNPLQNEKEINNRLDATEEIVSNIIERETLHKLLKSISDIERICGRIAYGNFNPKDSLSLKTATLMLPEVKNVLSKFKSKKLEEFYQTFDELLDISKLLDVGISENPSTLVRDGGVIKNGYSKELDELRTAEQQASSWLSELEAKERELTGIKNLKIAYNKVFGYYIEVNKSLINLVPYRYQRKQTVANNERYITEDLKIIEDKVLNASEQAIKLEQTLFEEIIQYLLVNLTRIQKTSKIVAELDVLLSNSITAVKNNYCKPKINKRIDYIKIAGGRHPVVESLIKSENFVSNDTYLNETTDKSMIITGPNMAGKSTYMRQVALIVLLAHMGSFVPATSAEICITDRIFTRVGASDDLAFGQSTFMVEMTEVANILNNATDKSLAILDEIGRGTSTFDGLSIAWAVMEFINNNTKMKTLFSTHYHELTELEGFLPGVKNYRITVKEFNDEVIFLRKIVRGGANKSFGVAVASLAGLPKEVITRAKEISVNLEKADINRKIAESNLSTNEDFSQIQESNSKIVGILKDIDINKLTPLSAFEILVDLSEKVKK